MALVIAISNQKGGVAKTTTCASLGAAFVERGREVLVIDLDPQANLTLALGVTPASLRRTVTDVLLGNHSLVSVSRETSLPGLDLLPSNQGMQMAEKFLHVRGNYEHLLRHALANGVAHYDIVLCDCPPALGSVTLNALTAADLLIIPTQCEFLSAYGLNEMLELVRNLRERTNPRLSYRILITMFDRRNRIHNTIRDQLQQAFGSAVLTSMVEIDTKLRESPVMGEPITRYAPNSRAALQYRALAEELMQYAEQKAATSA
jgi:chromosome partitioning protein